MSTTALSRWESRTHTGTCTGPCGTATHTIPTCTIGTPTELAHGSETAPLTPSPKLKHPQQNNVVPNGIRTRVYGPPRACCFASRSWKMLTQQSAPADSNSEGGLGHTRRPPSSFAHERCDSLSNSRVPNNHSANSRYLSGGWSTHRHRRIWIRWSPAPRKLTSKASGVLRRDRPIRPIAEPLIPLHRLSVGHHRLGLASRAA